MHPTPRHRRRLRATALIAAGTTALSGLGALGLGASAGAAPASTSSTSSTAVAATAAPGVVAAPPSEATLGGLAVENSFVSSVGWVKPGETYPSRILLTNSGTTPVTGVSITVTAPRGSTITAARTPGGTSASPVPAGGTETLVWTVPLVPAGSTESPARVTLVLEHRADSLAQEPTIVWRDLSTTAKVTRASQSTSVTSHGPKVIPPSEVYDTARYGDRPFPIVPVQYTDRKYQDTHTGGQLEKIINDPTFEGSTFNLFQEMSLGQLFPEGTVPSAGLDGTDFTYEPGFDFTGVQVGQTCTGGVTFADSPLDPAGTPVYPERISDGVYNLPGNTAYYGADANGSALIGALAGVGALQAIDSGCGTPGKMVYDAAAIADPEVDYSDFDTDKDGVVDFFMAVFAGCGGNGASQLSVAGCEYADAPYDNVWPHSSSLEFYYTDPTTGLAGFTTDDQLKDLEGRPLWYTDTARTTMTTTDKGKDLKVFVRVGPYNVNPETAIDAASVISHEYGHSLGLPDFYSTGSRETYGDWNLMATDQSQNMDAFSRQEMGWVVPQVLDASASVTGWKDSKTDIDAITWQTPDGTPYTLREGTDGRVQNSQMYVAKLPGRQLLDPAVFDSGDKASKTHAWWSGSGNDFGCAPQSGRNLDVAIPQLAAVPADSLVELSMKSWWDIEWDYDYGFVLTTTDGGKTYTSNESENGYTTSNTDPLAGNPNQNQCQATFDNGLTGTSGSYQAGSEAIDRKAGETPEAVFLADKYDISELAGQQAGALRFSYATDPGLARPGWFVDDLKVTVTEPGKAPYDVLVADLETSGGPDDGRIFNGGCRKDLSVAQSCTQGWKFLQAGAASQQDHAYYLEMRDRSGFDFDGKGQADRGGAAFEAGLSLVYTDEAHGYGNTGTDNPPAQSPLDATPTPGSDTPELDDAAFTAATGRSSFSDAPAKPHVDNYSDPSTTSGDWEFAFGCLGFTVKEMAGADAAPANNLTGSVDLTVGSGCGEFDYGFLDEEPAGDNTAPQAAAKATPATVGTGDEVTLSAEGSTDAQSGVEDLDFVWDFGNGGEAKDATGEVVTASYDTAGTKTATVTVTDPQGAVDTASVTITVTEGGGENTAPTAEAKAKPARATDARSVRLSGKGSSDAETDAKDLTYTWDFHDGGSEVDARGRRTKHRFREVGVQKVTLTVTDEAGASDTDTIRFRVHRFSACQSGRVERSGSWRTVGSQRGPGGNYCDNAAKGQGGGKDVLRLDFSGPQAAVVYGTDARGGKATVLVDGERVGVISFKSDEPSRRVALERRFTGLGKGSHTLVLKVRSKLAYVDGFVTKK